MFGRTEAKRLPVSASITRCMLLAVLISFLAVAQVGTLRVRSAASHLRRSETRSVQKSGVGPIQKVLQLLQELEARVVQDGKVEVAQYSDYKHWCEITLTHYIRVSRLMWSTKQTKHASTIKYTVQYFDRFPRRLTELRSVGARSRLARRRIRSLLRILELL
jgi:hypothetical protein